MREKRPGMNEDCLFDLYDRVFKMKLDALMKLINIDGVLGRVVAHIHTIEFQKRGLPHAHLLIILHDADKPRTPEDIDKLVTAELPDEETDPDMFKLISGMHMHGPCGLHNLNNACMVDGCCKYGYPKDFAEVTDNSGEGYPVYRRRETTQAVSNTRNGATALQDNRWVVPYNYDLSKRFMCHINLEICSSVQSVKYICKYVHKGHDRAQVTIEEPADDSTREDTSVIAMGVAGVADISELDTGGDGDADVPILSNEILEYMDGRWVGASEAAWRLLEFAMHENWPSVQRLDLHLPDEQPLTFNAGTATAESLRDAPAPSSTLTAYFAVNYAEEDARQYLYHEICDRYVLHNKVVKLNIPCTWQLRKKFTKGVPVGRVQTAAVQQGERYYLRLLLSRVRGAMSFEHLRTVDGVIFPTFQAACCELGLLQDDLEWHRCLEDAAVESMPIQLRAMFAMILHTSDVGCPKVLWDDHAGQLCEDILIRERGRRRDPQLELSDEMKDEGLRALATILRSMGTTLRAKNMPEPLRLYSEVVGSSGDGGQHMVEQLAYDKVALQGRLDSLLPVLNAEQRDFFNTIAASLDGQSADRLFFLDSPGGCGKTFLLNLIMAYVRQKGEIAVAVASSGIAALLMDGGCTAHSRFGIPALTLSTESVSAITARQDAGRMLIASKVIVWDELPMHPKKGFAVVDRLLKDLMKNVDARLEFEPFGGKVMILAGDFRQVLPVVPGGSRAQQVQQSIKKHLLWPNVRPLPVHHLLLRPPARTPTSATGCASSVLSPARPRAQLCTGVVPPPLPHQRGAHPSIYTHNCPPPAPRS